MNNLITSVQTSTPLAALNANTFSTSMNVQGLPAGLWVRALWLKIQVTLTRGAGATNIEPEQMAQILRSLTINYGSISISTNGRAMMLVERVRAANRIPVNSQCTIAATEYTIWLPLRFDPVLPPGQQNALRPMNSELQGATVNVTFGNPFAAANIATIDTLSCQLWYSRSTSGKAADPADPTKPLAKGGIYIADYSDFPDNVLYCTDYEASLILAETRVDAPAGGWQSLSGTGNGQPIYTNCFSSDLDAADYDHQAAYGFSDAVKDQSGDLMLIDFPDIDALGALALTDFTKVFDERRDKGFSKPFAFQFLQRVAGTAIPYTLVGWSGTR